VVGSLAEDMALRTGNPSGTSGQAVASDDPAPAKAAPRKRAKKAGE
jgi:hypothetical protein